MRAIALAVLGCLAVAHVAVAGCSNQTYVGLTRFTQCQSQVGGACNDNTACLPSTTNCVNGVCVDQTLTTYNQTCDGNGKKPCGNNQQCRDGYCMFSNQATNDPCTYDFECASGTCDNYRCAALSAGSVCYDDSQCDIDSACISGACAPRIAVGQACSGPSYTDTCVRGAACFNGVCTQWFSQADGVNVGYSPLLCASGNVDSSNVCITPDNSKDGQACTADEGSYTCMCNTANMDQGVLIGQDPQFAQAAKDWASCALESNCHLPGFLTPVGPADGTCLYFACSKANAQLDCSFFDPLLYAANYMDTKSCLVDFVRQITGSTAQCLSWAYDCVQLPNNSPSCM